MITALRRELATLEGTPWAGLDADIWKCFDRICRAMAMMVAVLGGFPPAIAQAYIRYFRHAIIHNILAAGLGAPAAAAPAAAAVDRALSRPNALSPR